MKFRAISFAIVVFAAAPAHGHCQNIVFREVTRDAGLLKPLAGMMGHGGAWGDFDGDGRPDLYVGGFCDRPDEKYTPAKGPVPNRLFRNLGNGKFAMVKQPVVEYYGRTSGAVFADLDNNGTLDLYAANNAKPADRVRLKNEPQRSAQMRRAQFFRNDKGKFVDISKSSGASPESLLTARNIGVFDYDRDGLLDLFIVEDRFTKNPGSVLLRNKGNLQFENVTTKVGLPDDVYGLGLAVADINNDGRPDFFVPHSNRMFISKGNTQYWEPQSLRKTFEWKPLDNEDWPCGAAFADLNRDGLLDLVLTIHSEHARNKIYINTGTKNGVPSFRDVTKQAGFDDTVPIRCPHVEVQDFDNDGWPDIYISAGWLEDKDHYTPLVFRNTGAKNGVPQLVAPRPIKGPMVYFPAGPSADYDGDGRVDLFLINWFENNHSRLLHNGCKKQNWLDVRVTGKTFNRMGIGSQIRIYKAGQMGKQNALLGFQEMTIGYGYASGQVAVCHFGLGNETAVDVSVKLPNGRTMRFPNWSKNKLVVTEAP